MSVDPDLEVLLEHVYLDTLRAGGNPETNISPDGRHRSLERGRRRQNLSAVGRAKKDLA